MIKTTNMLLQEYCDYANPYNKIKRMVDSKLLFPIIKGLYETSSIIDGYCLAGSIYGPSYLSFDFALAYYGLIPERVYTYTCATCLKKKTKQYHTSFGNFTYQDVPCSIFSLGVLIKTEGEYSYLIATKEKALCDKLYSLKPVSNQRELKTLLFDDLRIDDNEFYKLNADDIETLSKGYKSKNIDLLSKITRRHQENENIIR